MAAIVSSMWNSDYSYFINILLEAPFCVSTGSRNSYEIIYCVFFIVPVFFANNVFLMNLYYCFSNRTDKKLLLTLGSILALFAPVLHFASWLGMPDIFGMFFVFGIIVLLINFNQEKFEWRTAVALALLIICLTVTRRWYLFWIVGFVPTIMVLYLAFAAIRDRSRLKPLFFSELKTGLLVIGFAAVVLAPFLYHNLIARDYAEEYSQWYYGGFPYEINHQIFLLGWLFIGLIAFGIIYGLVNKKLRIITITAVFGFLISLLAFTRIQNMGYHHCLLLFGFYILPLYNSREGRLSGFYGLVDKYELYVTSECSVYSTDNETVTRFALLSKHPRGETPVTGKELFFEFRIPHDGETLQTLLFSAEYYGLQNVMSVVECSSLISLTSLPIL